MANMKARGEFGLEVAPVSGTPLRLETNPSGDRTAGAVVEPDHTEGCEDRHGVRRTVRDAAGEVAYRTDCTAVTLD